MKYKERIVLLVGGNNVDYLQSGLKCFLKYKKDISIIIFTKNCSMRIKTIVKKFSPKSNYFNSNKPCQNKKLMFTIQDETYLGFNLGFNYLISKKFLKKIKIVNPHPSYLPFNKGSHHSFWSIIDGTPAGATIHWMNSKFDSGNIIKRQKLKLDKYISAEIIQKKSENLSIKLLSEVINKILKNFSNSIKQKKGTYHFKKDINTKDTLKYNQSIKIKDLFKLIRATYNKENGFYIQLKNEKFFIKIDKYLKI